MKKYRISTLHLAFVHPQGNALENYKIIVPSLSEVKPYLLESLEEYCNLNIRVLHFTPCFLDKYKNKIFQSIDKYNFYIYSEMKRRVSMCVELNRLKLKPKNCIGCKLIKSCDGIWKNYYNIFGGNEISPILN